MTIKHAQQCFITDKTRAVSVLNGFKNVLGVFRFNRIAKPCISVSKRVD